MPRWALRDIFDFEYFIHRDSDSIEAQLHQRDRSIYLGLSETEQASQPGALLFSWLQAMRGRLSSDTEGSHPLPGAAISEALKVLTILLPSCGLMLGLLSGAAFFSYSGTTPVNVFHFLFLFVFSQLLLLFLLLITALPRLTGRIKQSFPVTFHIYLNLLTKVSSWLQKRGGGTLSAEKRLRLDQMRGLVKKTVFLYRTLLYWSIFTLVQQTLIAINAGIMTATLFRIITSDIAFGWQSTVQFSSSGLHQLVQLIALPWSWLVPADIAYPSLSAIEGSRIILKDGIFHLATENLISWWPFLVLCLIFYGLLLRLLLAGLGHYFHYRTLKNLSFTSTDSMSILRRMQTPTVSTQAVPISPSPASLPIEQTDPASHSDLPEPSSVTITLLIPADIAEYHQAETIVKLLKHHGFTVDQQHIVMENYESDKALTTFFAGNKENNSVLLIQESWLPPIGDLFTFLKGLRKSVGTKTSIFIGLIGKSKKMNMFSPPTSLDRSVWKQKIAGLGDPYLSVIELTDPLTMVKRTDDS